VSEDEFIRAWHARTAVATTEALAHLASCDVSPVSDGVLGDWLRALAGLRFTDADAPYIVALIGKRDPHLQEAGIELATVALHSIDGTHVVQLEAAIEQLLAGDAPDSWVVEALVDYLATAPGSRTAIYEALARHHLAHLDEQARPLDVARLDPARLDAARQPSRPMIMRNRYIDPWRRLVREVYEQNAIENVRPLPRDLAVLPVLERVNDTRGWDATVRAILARMGFDADEHFARLRSFGR
jgi:hypothetical protein